MSQTTNSIFMVRPAAFGYNAETAASNTFQQAGKISKINEKAQREFDLMVAKLKHAGIDVFLFDDTTTPVKPDAIFPNNWVSLHADGSVALYPMLAPNRRLERRIDVLETLQQQFSISRILDLTDAEVENHFLEGTGSIVFDHINKTAFACLSPRTDKKLLNELCEQLGYSPICFDAFDGNGQAIYHTNVLLAIGTSWAVCCVEAIPELLRKSVIEKIEQGGRELISISIEQMSAFAGNMLALTSAEGAEIILLSTTALSSLTPDQKQRLGMHGRLLPLAIPTIEEIGGGSVRCMVAEIFLPRIPKVN